MIMLSETTTHQPCKISGGPSSPQLKEHYSPHFSEAPGALGARSSAEEKLAKRPNTSLGKPKGSLYTVEPSVAV